MQVAELTVRQNDVRPPLAATVTLSSGLCVPNGQAAIAILIHGYNNSYTEAKAAYEGFLTSLRKCATTSIAIPAYEFFWPGDEAMRSYSALSYPMQVSTVAKAASLLNTYLSGIYGPAGGPIDVHFVAHSLGNRLLLNLLNGMSLPPQLRVRSVTLMAAAVPVNMVEYGNPLYKGCMLPAFTQAFHSRSDDVLHYAFPLGESAIGEGFLPTAVGRNGDPKANWRATHAFDSFAHGDYWKRPGPPNLVLQSLMCGSARQTASSGVASRSTATRVAGPNPKASRGGYG